MSRGDEQLLTLDVCEVMNVKAGKKYTYVIDYTYREGDSEVELIGHGEMEGTVE